MKVAIVGAGLAGLSSCWFLCQFPGIEVTVFDPKGVGGGASGISTGLLHPFPGRRAFRSWNATKGMEETRALIAVAEQASRRSVCEATGIFRPAVTTQQREDFSLRAQKDGEAKWIEHSEFGAGLWIKQGITLYPCLYLQGLWRACQVKGATLISCAIFSLRDLDAFDAIALAVGVETPRFAPYLPLQVTKGQTLLCRWPKRLPFSLVSRGHITPTENSSFCHIGSTYEHHYSSFDPDPTTAFTLIEKVAAFYPPVLDFDVIEIRAGARISRPSGYRPLVEKLDARVWVFTGLGSRGMLYHSWLGKQVACEIRDFLMQGNQGGPIFP